MMVKAQVLSPEIFDRSDETVVLEGDPAALGAQAWAKVGVPLINSIIAPMDPEQAGDCLNAFLAATTGSIVALLGIDEAEQMVRGLQRAIVMFRQESQAKGEH